MEKKENVTNYVINYEIADFLLKKYNEEYNKKEVKDPALDVEQKKNNDNENYRNLLIKILNESFLLKEEFDELDNGDFLKFLINEGVISKEKPLYTEDYKSKIENKDQKLTDGFYKIRIIKQLRKDNNYIEEARDIDDIMLHINYNIRSEERIAKELDPNVSNKNGNDIVQDFYELLINEKRDKGRIIDREGAFNGLWGYFIKDNTFNYICDELWTNINSLSKKENITSDSNSNCEQGYELERMKKKWKEYATKLLISTIDKFDLKDKEKDYLKEYIYLKEIENYLLTIGGFSDGFKSLFDNTNTFKKILISEKTGKTGKISKNLVNEAKEEEKLPVIDQYFSIDNQTEKINKDLEQIAIKIEEKEKEKTELEESIKNLEIKMEQGKEIFDYDKEFKKEIEDTIKELKEIYNKINEEIKLLNKKKEELEKSKKELENNKEKIVSELSKICENYSNISKQKEILEQKTKQYECLYLYGFVDNINYYDCNNKKLEEIKEKIAKEKNEKQQKDFKINELKEKNNELEKKISEKSEEINELKKKIDQEEEKIKNENLKTNKIELSKITKLRISNKNISNNGKPGSFGIKGLVSVLESIVDKIEELKPENIIEKASEKDEKTIDEIIEEIIKKYENKIIEEIIKKITFTENSNLSEKGEKDITCRILEVVFDDELLKSVIKTHIIKAIEYEKQKKIEEENKNLQEQFKKKEDLESLENRLKEIEKQKEEFKKNIEENRNKIKNINENIEKLQEEKPKSGLNNGYSMLKSVDAYNMQFRRCKTIDLRDNEEPFDSGIRPTKSCLTSNPYNHDLDDGQNSKFINNYNEKDIIVKAKEKKEEKSKIKDNYNNKIAEYVENENHYDSKNNNHLDNLSRQNTKVLDTRGM